MKSVDIVTIATNVNVSNAIERSARNVFRKEKTFLNVTTTINVIAGNVMTMMLTVGAINVMLNAASNVVSKDIDEDSWIAQNVSKRLPLIVSYWMRISNCIKEWSIWRLKTQC